MCAKPRPQSTSHLKRPKKMRTPFSLVLLLVLATANCMGAQPEQPEHQTNSNDGLEGKADGYGSSVDCVDLCNDRAPHEQTDGWCPLDWGDDSNCVEACETAAQNVDVDALEQCVSANPLCFVTLEQCVESLVTTSAGCERWCDERAINHADDGFCEPFVVDSDATGCLESCATLIDQVPEGNLEECIQDNPLCFVDLGTCSQG